MTEERAPYHVEPEPAPESAPEHPKTLRNYFVEPEPASEQESAHEHLYRVVAGNKTIVRFCERCGRTWLVTELRDILHHGHFVYTWSEVLEEAEAHKKLMEANEPLPRA
ncbi:MAG TPA: hypothetical protein VFN02_04225 [Ktedonobacteraceae bacterium]|nr:hypothetical protein [Ktedonobacteraceae bacterium]